MHGNIFILRIIVVFTAVLGLNKGYSADWPQLLGTNADGISSETGLLSIWPKDGPNVLWKKEIGTGYSAPSTRDGRLVLFHRVGNEEIVEALNPKTTTPIWRHAYPTNYRDPFGYNNGPRCTPLLTETHCFTFGAEGVLLCLNVKTGKPIWQRKTADEFQVPEAFFGVGASPVLEGNLLIVMVGGQPNSTVVAFDKNTGSTVWQSAGRDTWQGKPAIGWPGEPLVQWRGYEKLASYATPTLATIHGRRTLFCLTRQGLVSMDPRTGEVNFSRWFRARVNESVNAANPIVAGDRVFCSAAYFGVGSFLLDIGKDGKSFNEVWSTNKRRKVDRRLKPALEIHWTTPILFDGHLYAFSGRNEPDSLFRCVELSTGKVKWSRDERWRAYSTKQPNVYGRGSAVLADGKLFVLGEGGLLGLFEATPSKPVELGRHQVPELKYPCWTAPVLSDKRMIVRSEDYLICFELAK
ncbi:MAG: PQQ-binding-like beta-propeller repeat protein [Verrucomicrobiota bacterium]|nr:PQQ-binding-like beta-propeller repeat protein [Verrucomicrobiota bacterium]